MAFHDILLIPCISCNRIKTMSSTYRRECEELKRVVKEANVHTLRSVFLGLLRDNAEPLTRTTAYLELQTALIYNHLGGAKTKPPFPFRTSSGELIPPGRPHCLASYTFVFTGTTYELSREKWHMLVKHYGGKVSITPSSKTSFCILGSDPDPTKLQTLRGLRIRTIAEDKLFELIATGREPKTAELVDLNDSPRPATVYRNIPVTTTALATSSSIQRTRKRSESSSPPPVKRAKHEALPLQLDPRDVSRCTRCGTALDDTSDEESCLHHDGRPRYEDAGLDLSVLSSDYPDHTIARRVEAIKHMPWTCCGSTIRQRPGGCVRGSRHMYDGKSNKYSQFRVLLDILGKDVHEL